MVKCASGTGLPQIVADDRESHVTRFFRDVQPNYNYEYKVQRIEVGDYCITLNDKIRAVVERKTWADLAASFRDGRLSNVEKLLELQSRTNCDIYYMIEGAASPSYNGTLSRMPVTVLMAHLDHLMIRHKIFVIYSRDSAYSAQRLFELARCYYTAKSRKITNVMKVVSKVAASSVSSASDVATTASSTNVSTIVPSIVGTTAVKSHKKVQEPVPKFIPQTATDVDCAYVASLKSAVSMLNIVSESSVDADVDNAHNMDENDAKSDVDNVDVAESGTNANPLHVIKQIDQDIKAAQDTDLLCRETLLRKLPHVGPQLSMCFALADLSISSILTTPIESIAVLATDAGISVGLSRAKKIVAAVKDIQGNSDAQAKLYSAVLSKMAARSIADNFPMNTLLAGQITQDTVANLRKCTTRRIGPKDATKLFIALGIKTQ